MPMPMRSGPKVEVAWYDDGVYYDMTSLTLAGSHEVKADYGRDTARATAPPMIGIADASLYNVDRDFSPDNPGTPWYQFIKPGRPARVSIQHGERRLLRSHWLLRSHVPLRGIGAWPLINGHLSSFTQETEPGDQHVKMSVNDLFGRLRRKRISCPLVGTTRTDTAVEAVLNAVGWPYDKRVLRVSDSVMNGWWVDERPAWDVLVELLATEGAGAVFYVDGFGTFYWLNRNHRVTEGRSINVQAVLHDGTYTGGGTALLYDIAQFGYDPKWDDIVDRVTITTTRRVLDASPSVVWKLGTDLIIAAGQTETLTIRPSNPFQSAISPVLATDYTVSGGTVSMHLSWEQGAVVRMTITGLTGTSTISALQLRATSFPVVGETDYEVASDADVVEGEERTLKIDAWPMLDPAHASAIASSYALRYQESRPVIDVTLDNLDGDAMEMMLYFRISDRVTIVNAHLGLTTDCWIERLQHVSRGDGRHRLTLSCEPVFAIGTLGAAWDTAIWDTSTWGI